MPANSPLLCYSTSALLCCVGRGVAAWHDWVPGPCCRLRPKNDSWGLALPLMDLGPPDLKVQYYNPGAAPNPETSPPSTSKRTKTISVHLV
jgi:hypothetical protein